jgi:hypothetical protein
MDTLNNNQKRNIKMLIIAYVPEIARVDSNAMGRIAETVENAFGASAKLYGSKIDCTKIVSVNHALVIKELKNMADFLSNKNNKGIIYYYGHGDQVIDKSGKEEDGYDEIWTTQKIKDDEISEIFNIIDDESYLFLFSDSCSSGSMIDRYSNTKNWVTISSSNDKQDSLATSDGGVFTLFGLIPGLNEMNKTHSHTPKSIHNYVVSNIQLGTQDSLLHYGNDTIGDINIFN